MGYEDSVSHVGFYWDYGAIAGSFYRNVIIAPSYRYRYRGGHVLFVQEIRELKNTCILIALPLGKT